MQSPVPARHRVAAGLQRRKVDDRLRERRKRCDPTEAGEHDVIRARMSFLAAEDEPVRTTGSKNHCVRSEAAVDDDLDRRTLSAVGGLRVWSGHGDFSLSRVQAGSGTAVKGA